MRHPPISPLEWTCYLNSTLLPLALPYQIRTVLHISLVESIYLMTSHILPISILFNILGSYGESSLPKQKEFFNTQLGSIYTISEHCVGVPKNWFRILKGMSTTIKERNILNPIMVLFDYNIILYNLLFFLKNATSQMRSKLFATLQYLLYFNTFLFHGIQQHLLGLT